MAEIEILEGQLNDHIENNDVHTTGGGGSGMTNAALQALINEYGKRLFSISFDNDRVLLIGYSGTPKLEDISLVTIGGVDFLKVKKTNTNDGKTIDYANMHLTSVIQAVGIMDEKDVKYGVDPILFR